MGMKPDLVTQLKLAGLPEPVPEYRFHPTRRWRFDLCWPDRMVAVEYEGLVYGGRGGRHQRAKGMTDDCEKYAEAILLGWKIIRVTHVHVKSGKALEWVQKALASSKGVG